MYNITNVILFYKFEGLFDQFRAQRLLKFWPCFRNFKNLKTFDVSI